MREVALRRVVDDVLQRHVERLVAELHREGLIRLRRRGCRGTPGSTVAGSLPMTPASAARSVPWPLPVALRLPNRCTLSAGHLRELIGRQLGAALVEVVGDAHRADRVRARRPGPDLVELFERGHRPGPWPSSRRRDPATRSLPGLGGGWRRRRRPPVAGSLAGAAGDDRHRADERAAHHEGAAIDTRGNLRRVRLQCRHRDDWFVVLLGLHMCAPPRCAGRAREADVERARPVPGRDPGPGDRASRPNRRFGRFQIGRRHVAVAGRSTALEQALNIGGRFGELTIGTLTRPHGFRRRWRFRPSASGLPGHSPRARAEYTIVR